MHKLKGKSAAILGWGLLDGSVSKEGIGWGVFWISPFSPSLTHSEEGLESENPQGRRLGEEPEVFSNSLSP